MQSYSGPHTHLWTLKNGRALEKHGLRGTPIITTRRLQKEHVGIHIEYNEIFIHFQELWH